MNLILLFKDDFITNSQITRIQGRRLEHVLNVHKASIGDNLCVGLLNDKIGAGKVLNLDNNALELDVTLDRDPPAATPAALILAMPRPRVLKRILSHTCAMGIKKIVLINSYRVEKSFWKSPLLKEENLNKYLMLGLEQARDTILPEVIIKPLFKPFVEDELPAIIKDTHPYVAHPYAPQNNPRAIETPATIAIGPEGGFTTYEVAKLEESGFTSINLGQRILPVETAVPFLVSKLI